MRLVLIFFGSVIIHHFSFSQINAPEIKNLYTFSLVNGINRNNTRIDFGEKSPENSFAITKGLNFHYTRILQPKFSLSAGLGFGFLPININVNSFDTYVGTDVFRGNYFSRFNYKAFARLEVLASYHQKLTDKLELKYNFGGGIIHYGSSSNGFSMGANYTDSTQAISELYDVDIKFSNSVKPFLSLGLELDKKLKNLDLLSFKLTYDYSFSKAYDGTYSVYDNTSRGQYFNNGNYLNFHVGYTITGSKRLNDLKTVENNLSVSRKVAKKINKKQSRYIDPKSIFLNFSGGLGIGGTKVSSDPNGILENGGYASFLPRISVEKGIKNNFYGEIGLHSQLFWDVSKFSYNKYGSSGSGAFYAVQASFGGVYRWILRNNYNVINIHSGISLGFQPEKNGSNGLVSWGSGSENGTFNGDTINFNYSQESTIKSNLLASVYLGFSKDFRIVNNFYFTLNYRQQFGLFKVYESIYDYEGTNIPATVGAKTKITGSSKDFQLGFKIKIR